MVKKLTLKQQKSILSKLKQIIGPDKKRKFLEKDIEIENARIKNITQSVAAFGAQPQNFIGMLTITFSKQNRVLPNDDLNTIIKKTQTMYYSVLFLVESLKKELRKKNFNLIYLTSFELQKDANLHAHIYFSIPLKAFYDFFVFYHTYNKTFLSDKKIVTLNKIERTIVPIGRCQLEISEKFKHNLEKIGFKFEYHINPQKSDRIDWRCTNFVNKYEFYSGKWPTLFFYNANEFEKLYGQKIIEYLTKKHTKQTTQKAIGSQYIKHNSKSFDKSDEWSEIQKQFIRKVCGKVYTASRLPIQINAYQKKRKNIIEIYPQYRNFNTLITDYLNGKAIYKNGI